MNQSKMQLQGNRIMDLSPRWITPQINGPIMSLSFGRKVIDLLGSSLSQRRPPRFRGSYMCMSVCLASVHVNACRSRCV